MPTDADRDTAKSVADDDLRLENQLSFALYNNANKTSRLFRPLLDPFGLTFPQYLVMLALWGRPACTVSDLSRALYLESNTLTPLLKRLEVAGYIRRQRDRDDERCVRILLTPKGEAFRVDATAMRERVIRQMALPEADVANLKRTLHRLSQRLDVVTAQINAPVASALPSQGHAEDDHEQ